MEQEGKAINAIGTLLKIFFKGMLYLLWGATRILEVLLKEINSFLKHVLEKKR